MSTSNSDPMSSVPEAMSPRIEIDPTTLQFDFFNGEATLRSRDVVAKGRARVYFDMLPVPEFRFEFEPESPLSLKDAFFKSPLGDGLLEAGNPIGHVNVHVSRTGRVYSGSVHDQLTEVHSAISTAEFLIINGPHARGSAIRRGVACGGGRLTATGNGLKVTIDPLGFAKQDRRSVYESTHVARCEFDPPLSLDKVHEIATDLFRTLSLMKCRWVGVLGPWLMDSTGADIGFRAVVTKTMRHGSSLSWCHSTIRDAFSRLFPEVYRSFRDPVRADALQTAFHWLLESEQCAGGVEGAIILQQAALECLAWLEIVQTRHLCSETGFNKLPASDKIRWLLSLSQISARIPEKSESISAYAKDFNLTDMAEVLVNVRNALVHAAPKQTAKLFARDNGEEERSNLWYQCGGMLQQAMLASLGYSGQILRRDVDAEFASGAVSDAPWAPSS